MEKPLLSNSARISASIALPLFTRLRSRGGGGGPAAWGWGEGGRRGIWGPSEAGWWEMAGRNGGKDFAGGAAAARFY